MKAIDHYKADIDDYIAELNRYRKLKQMVSLEKVATGRTASPGQPAPTRPERIRNAAKAIQG